ncbi:Cytochrome P450 [Canna indica]|uniref:Cytochrome P450 n=1 Tax=Canna indica TaxID=4628 RepID=A0AAQ3JL36_9LILI|nr:Cytochrome P450 [Canna indica]
MGSSWAVESASYLVFLPNAAAFPSIVAVVVIALSVLLFYPGGFAWALSRAGRSIPGPPGMVLALSGTAAHRALANLADSLKATDLMAFSFGFTRFILSSRPDTAREILNSSAFADRPVKESAYELLFHRAMGFAPFGEYWRNLRRISATYMFSPARIAALAEQRSSIGHQLISEVKACMETNGSVVMKKALHYASLNSIMTSVFGKRFDFGEVEGMELEELVSEGYELLGALNWSDHFPMLMWMDPQGIRNRCRILVARVNVFVGGIIEEHRRRRICGDSDVKEGGDFVDVLLDLEKEDRLSDSDMVAVLWEMIFRGTDTVAILLEWIMARMTLHPEIQSKAQAEIDAAVGGTASRAVSDSDIPNLPYLQSIVKETLRLHPPGPLLSWSRLAVHDTHVGDHFIPAGTTAMVNMWAITHDDRVWPSPNEFKPERFMEESVSVLGADLRLAPFGAGRRVCPGKALAMTTVHLWLAQLLQSFKWLPVEGGGSVDLSECLKMSLEMKNPLVCRALPRY